MQKLIYIAFFFLSIPLGLSGQTFTISIDTLKLNIKEIVRPATRVDLTHAVKYKDKYYCFFKENGLYSFKIDTRYFLIISENGIILNQIDIPEEIKKRMYFDFFIRHDSLLTKTYIDHESFYFDVNKLAWKKIKEVDDRVYEDNKFIVIYLDFGEWGESTWFIDKASKKEYVVGTCGTTINLLNGKYYLTNGTEIREIENPLHLKQCDTDYYYEIAEKKKHVHEGSPSLIGSTPIYKDTTFSPWSSEKPKQTIVTSFVSNNQLYHLFSDSNATYIAKIVNGVVIPIQNMSRKFSTFNWHYFYRGNNLDNNSRFLKFKDDNNTFGFIEINNNKIDIHYLKHNQDSLNYLGTDGFDKLLKLAFYNLGNFSLKQMDSIENNLSGTDMRSDRIGISHNSHYPEIYNSLDVKTKEYIKVEDKLMAQTTEYLYTTADKLIKSIFIEWSLTEPYRENNTFVIFGAEKPEVVERFKSKFKEIEQITTRQIGEEPKKKIRGNDSIELTWISKNGFVINLYASDTFKGRKEIRMIMYKK